MNCGSLPVWFVRLNTRSKRNLMQYKEKLDREENSLCQEFFLKNLGQTTVFVAKCNTGNRTEEKCNVCRALPNEMSPANKSQ